MPKSDFDPDLVDVDDEEQDVAWYWKHLLPYWAVLGGLGVLYLAYMVITSIQIPDLSDIQIDWLFEGIARIFAVLIGINAALAFVMAILRAFFLDE